MTDRPSEVFPTTDFNSRAEFQAEVIRAVNSAQREIWLADADFSTWPMNSPAMESSLHQFLLASRANQVRLLVQSPDHLQQNAPRFMRTLRTFAHLIICRQPSENVSARFGQEVCLAIVDRARMVRRFHRDTMRGTAVFNPSQVGTFVDQFETLWEEGQAGISASTLGLDV